MFRKFLVVTATLCAGLHVTPLAAQSGKSKPAEPLKGQIDGEPTIVLLYQGLNTQGYATEVPIKLKAGLPVTVSVTVVGANRLVGATLLDPKKVLIGGSKALGAKTTRFTVDETNANGEYKIQIVSNLIGGYTLTVSGEAAEGFNKKALELNIERLKKELAEAEAALKALDKKEEK